MANGILTLDFTAVKSALVSTVLMAILTMSGYVIGLGDVSKIDGHTLLNLGVMSLLTGLVSLIKNFLTTNDGKFLGATQTA